MRQPMELAADSDHTVSPLCHAIRRGSILATKHHRAFKVEIVQG